MEMLVVIWLIFGLCCASIAKNKGRDRIGWFICGILLGPIALIMVAFTSKNQASLDRSAIRRGSMKKCPYCAEAIKNEAIKCRYCGASLDKESLEKDGMPLDAAPAEKTPWGKGVVVKYCRHCEEQNYNAATSCIKCGALFLSESGAKKISRARGGGIRICPHCGSKNRVGDLKCLVCSEPI